MDINQILSGIDKSKLLCDLENKLNIKRERLAIGLGLLVFYFLIGVQVICNTLGFIYPCYMHLKIIKNNDTDKYLKYSLYWMIFALFHTVEIYLAPFLYFFSIYHYIKSIVLIALLHPRYDGCVFLYDNYIKEAYEAYEPMMDNHYNKYKSLIFGEPPKPSSDDKEDKND